MLKLYKNFKTKDWLGLLLIVGLTVLQVYLTMTIVDYVQNIIKAITYVNYHNNPGQLNEAFGAIIEAAGWESITKEGLIALGMDLDSVSKILLIKEASVADIWLNGGLMLVFAFALALTQSIISLLASFLSANLTTSIRTKIYRKVESFSLKEISRFSTPSLVTRTSNDIQNIQMANLMTMRMIFAAPVTAIWAICKIRASSLELTWTTVIAILVLLVIVGAIMLIALPKFKIMQKLTDGLNNSIRENLKGIRIIRAFNAEKHQEEKFDEANTTFTKAQLFTGKIMSLLNPSMMLIMNGLSLLMYWIGAGLINQGEIDYPTVTAFMILSSQIIMSFLMLMMLFILWPRALVSAKRVNEVLETEPSIVDPKEPKEFSSVGEIEFKNVSFSYQGNEDYAIKDISFKVSKGETIALIGATGSGKTSIINLIPRLYDATKGEVYLDGVNVKDVPLKKLREKIGYIPQKAFLFKGSVKSNIALSHPDTPLEKVKEASEIAEASSFVEAKEEGYDFQIGQGGKNVSGGQRQRLCIARALVNNPEILIFDDSFSALDYQTDRKVRDNLASKMKEATKIIVAQRVGTIKDADKILVIEQGKIVGEGKHEELLKTSQVYQEIALSQLSKEELGL